MFGFSGVAWLLVTGEFVYRSLNVFHVVCFAEST
jgi:hypothetical protein